MIYERNSRSICVKREQLHNEQNGLKLHVMR